MPSLLGSLKRASDHYTSGSPSLGAVHPNHILLSLKALCTGLVELNDTDFEQLENYLRDSEALKDSGLHNIINFKKFFSYCQVLKLQVLLYLKVLKRTDQI